MGQAFASFVRDSLKLYYPFKDNSPDFLLDGSTSFDGTDDYIGLPTFSDTTALSVTGWIYLDSSFSGTVYFINSGDFDLNVDFVSTTGEMRVNRNNAYHPRYTNISTNQWVHLAITTTNKTADPLVYFNGSLQSGTGNTDYGTLLGSGTFIGQSGSGNYFKGKMANVAIHSSALTQSQVQELMFTEKYQNLSADLKTNLVSFYDLGSTEISSDLTVGDSWVNGVSGNHLYETFTDNGDGKVTFANSSGFGMAELSAGILENKTYRLTFTTGSGTYSDTLLHITYAVSTLSYSLVSQSLSASTSYTIDFHATRVSNQVPSLISLRTGNGVSDSGSITAIELKEITLPDSKGSNDGSASGATVNTDSYSGGSPFKPRVRDLATPSSTDPLNFGEVYSGRALNFDGSNAYVNCGDGTSLDITSNISLSFWAKFDDVSTTQFFMGRDNDTQRNFELGISSTKLFWSIYSGGSAKGSGGLGNALSVGIWYHIVATYDGSNLKTYVDGSLTSTTSGTGSIDNDNVSFTIGARAGGMDRHFDGKMSSVKVFNNALTQAQVQELYTNPEQILPTGISASNLKLDLPMQEGSDDYVYDGSGNKNDGTISGATWATGEEYGYQASLVRSNTPMIFDGNDFVTIPKLTISGDHTVSAWANIISQGVVVGGSGTSGVDSNAIYPNSNTNIFYKSGSGSFCSIPMNSGVSLIGSGWRHILIVKQTGNDVKAYIDGVFQTSSVTYSGALSDDIDINFIGKRNTGGIINAIINEVAAWNTALDSDAITALYNSGVPLLPTSDSGNYDNSSALQGYWRNDGNTTWTDRSTNSNNGTASGSPVSIVIPEGNTSGRDNQGFLLSNTHQNSLRLYEGEYVQVDDSAVLQNIFDGGGSVEAWIYAEDWGESDAGRIISKCGSGNSNGWQLLIASSGVLQFLVDWSTTDYNKTGGTISLNRWHHVAVTYDSTTAGVDAVLYIDGSSVTVSGTGSAGSVVSDSGQKIRIGARGTGLDREFDGLVDEVRLYDKILSASEVLKNYNSGKASHQ